MACPCLRGAHARAPLGVLLKRPARRHSASQGPLAVRAGGVTSGKPWPASAVPKRPFFCHLAARPVQQRRKVPPLPAPLPNVTA